MSKRFVYVIKNEETPSKYYTGGTSDVGRDMLNTTLARVVDSNCQGQPLPKH
jgi:hypothetical protein